MCSSLSASENFDLSKLTLELDGGVKTDLLITYHKTETLEAATFEH